MNKDDQDALVQKMTTPPVDPEEFAEPKPGSYEKLMELAEEIRQAGDGDVERWDRRSSDLWDSVGKKDAST